MMFHRSLAVATVFLLVVPLGRAAEPDTYLPEDTEFILNLNVRQLLDSPLVKKNFLELAQEGLRGDDQVQDVLKDLGFDPFKDLDRLVIASPGRPEKDRYLLIAHGRFNVDKFKAKGEEVAKEQSDYLAIQKVLGGKHLLYKVTLPNHDDPFFVALAGRDTLLASFGKDYVIDALKKSKDPTKPILKSTKFQGLLEKFNADQSLSVAAVANKDMKKKVGSASGDIKEMVDKIQAVGGGLTITDEIKLELIVTTKNTKDAKELRDSTKSGLASLLALASLFVQNNSSPEAEFLVEIIKGLSVTNKAEAVILKGRISNDLIEDTLKKKSK